MPRQLLSWITFKQVPDCHAAFRQVLAQAAQTEQGVVFEGDVGLTSHTMDAAIRSNVPVIFRRKDGSERLVMGPLMRNNENWSQEEQSSWFRAMKRANLRVFIRVFGAKFDEADNLREADIAHFDRLVGESCWVPFQAGKRICLNGFRIELRNTKRAGLHLRIGVADEISPLNAKGFKVNEARFLAMVPLKENGVIVLTPSDPVEPSYHLGATGRPADEDERQFLTDSLRHFYRVPDRQISDILAGRGKTAEAVIGYAVSTMKA